MFNLSQYVPVQQDAIEEVMSDYESITKTGKGLAFQLPESQIRSSARKEVRGSEPINLESNNLTGGMRDHVVNIYKKALNQAESEIEKSASQIAKLKTQADECWKQLTEDAGRNIEALQFKKYDEIEGEELADAELKINQDIEQNAQIVTAQYRQLSGGRNPRIFNKMFYMFVMVLFGSIEFFVNIFALSQTFIPIFAVAVALAIGVTFAFSCHKVGLSVKAIPGVRNVKYAQVNKSEVYQGLALGLVLFLLAFATVVYLRYEYLQTLYGSSISGVVGEALGVDSNSASNLIVNRLIEVSLINLLIWVFGAAFAWWAHDVYPQYPTATKELQNAQRNIANIKQAYQEKRKLVDKQIDKMKLDVSKLIAEQKDISNRLGSACDDLKKELARRQKIYEAGVTDALKIYLDQLKDNKEKVQFVQNGKAISFEEYQTMERNIDA